MADARYYDALETRDPEARERALMTALPQQVAHAKRQAPYFAALLQDIEPHAVTSREALAELPVTRKSQLIALQKKAPPFGGLAAAATGAHALGCAVIPGGTGQTEQQVKAIADLRPVGYVGTPSFLRIILDKGRELGADMSSLKRALVSGEAFPPALRNEIAGRGVAAVQAYGTADLGLVAYETEAHEGLVIDEGIILELVRPGTGDLVAEGEVGEVVVTTLTADYPLIRFATGDLSAMLPGLSPCGRTNTRIAGWMGRADQTTKVKGMFVHPEQIAEAVKRHQEIGRARLVVSHDGQNDVMTLKAEAPAGTRS